MIIYKHLVIIISKIQKFVCKCGLGSRAAVIKGPGRSRQTAYRRGDGADAQPLLGAVPSTVRGRPKSHEFPFGFGTVVVFMRFKSTLLVI